MLSDLLTTNIQDEVHLWLKDDCPKMDVGGYVVGDKQETASLYCKSFAVLAGIPFVNEIFRQCDVSFVWKFEEGSVLNAGNGTDKIVVAEVTGKAKDILRSERVCLNILSRASGVAFRAMRAVTIKEANNWHGFVAATRKTTPGFASVEKYALLVGGAATHRMDLSQMVMLKDNHIWSAGSITNAVKKARIAAGFSMKIEVECQSVEEALEACAAGADIVMLDNFTHEAIPAAAKAVKEAYPYVLIEASGGITEDTMHLFMIPDVDIISRGSLTQGYQCADFSLKNNV